MNISGKQIKYDRPFLCDSRRLINQLFQIETGENSFQVFC